VFECAKKKRVVATVHSLHPVSPLIFVPFRSQKAMWLPSSLSGNTQCALSRTCFFFPSLVSLNWRKVSFNKLHM
jgi:hypothetical protein